MTAQRSAVQLGPFQTGLIGPSNSARCRLRRPRWRHGTRRKSHESHHSFLAETLTVGAKAVVPIAFEILREGLREL